MNHERFAHWLDDYVDGTLPSAERAELEAHLAACADCSTNLARLRALLETVRRLPLSVAPARDLWPGLGDRLATDDLGVQPVTVSSVQGHRRGHRWRPVFGLAAAAGVLLLAASVWYEQRAVHRPSGGDVAHAPGSRALTAAPSAASEPSVLTAVVTAFERECMGAGKALQSALAGRSDRGRCGHAAFRGHWNRRLGPAIAETRAALDNLAMACYALLALRTLPPGCPPGRRCCALSTVRRHRRAGSSLRTPSGTIPGPSEWNIPGLSGVVLASAVRPRRGQS